jgi:TonB family protein
MTCEPLPAERPLACGTNCATDDQTPRKDSDKEVVRRVIRQHIDEARACYETLLLTQPSARGQVRVRFAVGASGTVAASCVVSADLGAPSVDACLLDRVLTWRFPKPQGSGWVIVEYPFIFVPKTN